MESKLYRKGYTQVMTEVQRDPRLLSSVVLDYISLGHRCETLESAIQSNPPVNIPITSGTTTTDQLREMLENLMQEITARRSSNGVKLTLNYNGDNITVAPVNTSVDVHLSQVSQELSETRARLQAESRALQTARQQLAEAQVRLQTESRALQTARQQLAEAQARLQAEPQPFQAANYELLQPQSGLFQARAELPKEQPVVKPPEEPKASEIRIPSARSRSYSGDSTDGNYGRYGYYGGNYRYGYESRDSSPK